MNGISENVLNKKVFASRPGTCLGCGPQIGLKLVLQLLENPLIITDEGCISSLTIHPHSVVKANWITSESPMASALSIADSEFDVICFAKRFDPRYMEKAKNEPIVFVRYNHFNVNEEAFFENYRFSLSVPYFTTSSISHLDDFAKKLKYASETKKLSLIDLLSPCPKHLKCEPSNVVQLARTAITTGIWALIEIKDNDVIFNDVPANLEPVDRFLDLQKRYLPSKEEKDALQERVERNRKMLLKKRVWNIG